MTKMILYQEILNIMCDILQENTIISKVENKKAKKKIKRNGWTWNKQFDTTDFFEKDIEEKKLYWKRKYGSITPKQVLLFYNLTPRYLY